MAIPEGARVLERLDGNPMVDGAAKYAATKAQLASVDRAFAEISSGNLEVYLYFRYALAKEIVQVLTALNDDVREVFLLFENRCEAIPGTPLHIGVVTNRKTAALESLVESLAESILAVIKVRLLPLEGVQHLIVIELFDHSDAQSRVGAAAALGSLHEPPLRLWPQRGVE